MRKVCRIATCLILAGLVFSPMVAAEEPTTFEVEWMVKLPRASYFIGENITFVVVAFSSLDPTLKIPGQYANILIRNGSGQVVYETWLATDANGTIVASWDSTIDSAPGMYAVIVTDGFDNQATASFEMIFDESIYWQSRMEEMEQELAQVYEYLNYLFAQTSYLQKSLEGFRSVIYVCLAFLSFCLFLTMVAWFPTMAQRLQGGVSGANPVRALGVMMGFGNPIRTHVDHVHEDMGNAYTPPEKAPPRHGRDEFCERCDPERKYPLTAWELRVHDKEEHGRWANARRLNRAKKMRALTEKFEREVGAEQEPAKGEYTKMATQVEKRLTRLKKAANRILPPEPKKPPVEPTPPEPPKPEPPAYPVGGLPHDDLADIKRRFAELKGKVERGEIDKHERELELDDIRGELKRVRKERTMKKMRKLKAFDTPPAQPSPAPPAPKKRGGNMRRSNAIYDKVTGEVIYRDGVWYKNPDEVR